VYLTGVYLISVYPKNVYLTGVHLMGVHLTGVHLIGVYLMGVHLIGVYFMGVYLIDLYFRFSKIVVVLEIFDVALTSLLPAVPSKKTGALQSSDRVHPLTLL
jgi:hypothetical protein